tara:strand:- start:102 stop:731 length:630 start_codon:yes stop_codon:yes gene_type:complete
MTHHAPNLVKLCIRCNKEIDGKHLSYCKSCNNKRAAEYQRNNKEQIREQKKEYYQNNKEQIKEQKKEYHQNNKEQIKEYYQNNKEKILEQRKEYRENNKEYYKEYKKEYRKKNPHKGREYKRKRRALKQANVHEPYTEDQVLKLYGTDCHICQEEIDLSANRSAGAPGWERALHIDHVIPLSQGGPDTLENVKPAHGLCNLQKADKEKA